MRTIIYLRTSTEEQNPENQLKDCKSFSEGLKLNEFEVFQEKQSAFKDDSKREVFNNILKEIKKGKVDHIIVWDWDRLFRNRKRLKEFFEFCKIYNCNIHSFRQKFYEDFYNIPEPFNYIIQDLFINLLGWMAEDESIKKSERVKLAYKNRKQKWGRKPLENVEESIIKLHDKGLSIREITQQVYYWNKSRNKKFVSVGAVHKVINNYRGSKS